MSIVIAIDGTAASGKGTLARKIASALDYAYLDTGKLYRYIGYSILQNGQDPADKAIAIDMAMRLKDTLSPADLADPALGSDEAGQAASKCAQFQPVRDILISFQREFAENPPQGKVGAILDGRDIGTVIYPDAPVKLYIDAKTAIRAERRTKELQSKGISVTYDAVLADMLERDKRDASRSAAPMKPADDAKILDTSDMTIEEVLNQSMDYIRNILDQRA
jgi:cytidylate kinase